MNPSGPEGGFTELPRQSLSNSVSQNNSSSTNFLSCHSGQNINLNLSVNNNNNSNCNSDRRGTIVSANIEAHNNPHEIFSTENDEELDHRLENSKQQQSRDDDNLPSPRRTLVENVNVTNLHFINSSNNNNNNNNTNTNNPFHNTFTHRPHEDNDLEIEGNEVDEEDAEIDVENISNSDLQLKCETYDPGIKETTEEYDNYRVALSLRADRKMR